MNCSSNGKEDEGSSFGIEKAEEKISCKVPGNVNSICFLKDGRLVSCSTDKTIRVFNLTLQKFDLVIQEHNSWVNDIILLQNGNLASCSTIIKVFQIQGNDYKCIETFDEHTDKIQKMVEINEDCFASCSNDEKIKIWSFTNKEKCVKTLSKNNCSFSSIIFIKSRNYLVSTSYQSEVLFWNLANFEFLCLIKNVQCCSKNSIIEFENKILVGSFQGFSIVNTDTLTLETQVNHSKSYSAVYSVMEINHSDFIFGGFGELFQVNEIFSTVHKKEKVHNSAIVCLIPWGSKGFVSSSGDGVIKFWSY